MPKVASGISELPLTTVSKRATEWNFSVSHCGQTQPPDPTISAEYPSPEICRLDLHHQELELRNLIYKYIRWLILVSQAESCPKCLSLGNARSSSWLRSMRNCKTPVAAWTGQRVSPSPSPKGSMLPSVGAGDHCCNSGPGREWAWDEKRERRHGLLLVLEAQPAGLCLLPALDKLWGSSGTSWESIQTN